MPGIESQEVPSRNACCRLMTSLCVEDQLHQMTELCPVLTGWRRSVRNFRNGLGILDRRIVVRAMHDDHVQGWNDENVVSPISPRGIDSGKRDFREMNTAVIHPPEILVTAVIRAVGLHHLIGVTTFFDPGFGHDLFAVPAAVTQIEQAETRHIARSNLKVVSGMNGKWAAKIEDVARLEILHANRLGYALIKGVADLHASLFFKDRPQDIKIPIVVIPERARRVTPAGWPALLHGLSFEIYLVVHARPCAQQIHNARLLLFFRERVGRIVDAQLLKRLVDVNHTFSGINSVKSAQ